MDYSDRDDLIERMKKPLYYSETLARRISQFKKRSHLPKEFNSITLTETHDNHGVHVQFKKIDGPLQWHSDFVCLTEIRDTEAKGRRIVFYQGVRIELIIATCGQWVEEQQITLRQADVTCPRCIDLIVNKVQTELDKEEW
jgi:hypothetical protein